MGWGTAWQSKEPSSKWQSYPRERASIYPCHHRLPNTTQLTIKSTTLSKHITVKRKSQKIHHAINSCHIIPLNFLFLEVMSSHLSKALQTSVHFMAPYKWLIIRFELKPLFAMIAEELSRHLFFGVT